MSEYDKTGIAGAAGADGFGEDAVEVDESGAGVARVAGFGEDAVERERSGAGAAHPAAFGRRAGVHVRSGGATVHAAGYGGDFTGRLTINVTEITRAGAPLPTPTPSDRIHLHHLPGNDGKLFLEIVSTDPGEQTITVQPNPGLFYDGLGVEPLVLVIPAGATVYHGCFRPNTFNQDIVDNDVWLDPSVSGTLALRAYRFDAADPY